MYGMTLADRFEESGAGFRCTGKGCGITVAVNPDPEQHSRELREQVAARLCTACFRKLNPARTP
jgi:hypothetical protein